LRRALRIIVSWNGSIHFSSAGKCLPLSRMQTILQAGLLAPGSSYSPAFPNQGSVALSAFVPVTAAGPLPARIDSTLTGFPITPFGHPEVRYFISPQPFCVNFCGNLSRASAFEKPYHSSPPDRMGKTKGGRALPIRALPRTT